MKWKITLKYILGIIWVVMIVTILNICVIIGVTMYNNLNAPKQAEDEFTRDFKKYIVMKDDNIFIDKEGIDVLDKKHIWIQILDEELNEVYRYNAPENLNKKHTPIEFINGYKYAGGFENTGADTILASSKVIGNKEYTYIIGFDRKQIQKYEITFNGKNFLDTTVKIIWFILFIDLIIALLFGYIFGKKITKPMKRVIEGVENLEEGKYDIFYKEKGSYQSVYHKLNKLADTLKSNEDERNKLDKLKQEWIANISHDIKTPLSSIKGYAELLSDSDYEIDIEEAKDYGIIINEKSEYIKELVDDLNLTMKLKNSDRVLDKKEMNIVRIVKDSLIQILNDTKYSNRDIEFITNKDIIKREVDINLFKRVINNLVYNAIIHNNDDISIVVSIDYKNDNETIISIKDNGNGISKIDLERVFDRYYRGTNTGENHKGSGLGMAIAKEIINAHGFDIDIDSELGVGTIVCINIK